MANKVRWIISAISLFYCAQSAASSLDLSVRVQNSSANFLSSGRLCGLTPRTLNGVAYDWEVTASLPIRHSGSQYCLDIDGVGPYQVRQVNLKWRPLTESRSGLSSEVRKHNVLAQPSKDLLQLVGSFSRYPKSERVDRIYDWMLANIAFSGIRREIDGAEHALRTREGDCTEHMLLAAELLDRNGFTIRRVLGVALSKSQFRVTANTLHNWVEYLDGGQWLIFDSSRHTLGKPDQYHYLALHFYEDSQQLRLAPLSTDQPHLKLYLQ